MVRLHALGGLVVTDGERTLGLGGARQRRLVAMLLIHRNTVVSTDRLADAVFAGEPTPAAATTLRSYVARFRKVVGGLAGAPELVTRAPGYELRVPDGAFDVVAFERLLAEATGSLARADAGEAAVSAERALGLWRGAAYAEFADEDWARPEAQRLEELRLVAHERFVEAELARGRAAEVISTLESLVAEHPLREVFWRQLVIARFRTGRQPEALRAMRELRDVLREEVGLSPTPAMVELERRVLDHDPTLLELDVDTRRVRGYHLGERLGSGRDGTVHAAHLAGVDRELVIRVMSRELADDSGFVRDFEAAARRVAGIRHPGLIPIYDHWREPGAGYLVMRRARGGTLADRLAQGPLTPAATARVVARVGGGLIALSVRGIAHGRVAPESTFLDVSGDAVLGDPTFDEREGATAHGDVCDLAALVRRCLAVPTAEVVAVLERAADATPPLMDAFVPALVDALATEVVADPLPALNPYKGLDAFDEQDAGDFFGRAGVVDAMLARLGAAGVPLVLVVGGSGTGKSSAVRAGLLPRIRGGAIAGSQRWLVAAMVPGAMPFRALADALRHVAVEDPSALAAAMAAGEVGFAELLRRVLPPGGELLLIVDQFEELFTLAGEHDRKRFLDELTVALTGGRLRVVATLRADFYDRPLASSAFGALVSEATVTLPPMAATELEAAIVEPVRRIGGAVEATLVGELIAAVVDEPAALPSLQFTLFELAEQRPDRQLTATAYHRLGGLSGAIAARAEALHSTLPGPERDVVRPLFEQLCVVGADGGPTRRRAPREELSALGPPDVIDRVIDRWVRARLLSIDHHPRTRVPTVEVAHEAVLRSWPRLQRWIDEDHAGLRVRGELREAAAGWQELDRDPGALYRGVRLDAALDATGSAALPETERDFLEASVAGREDEQRRLAADVARQARANRRLRIQLGVIAVALVAALVVGAVAVQQRRHADQARRIATGRELAAAADANLDVDPELSTLLARRAVDLTRTGGALPDATAALHRAVGAARLLRTLPGVGGAIDWSPDGRRFVTEGPEESGVVDIRDADTGDSLLSFEGHDVDINDVAFSPDGSLLATAGDDGALRVWDPTTGRLVFEHVAPPGNDIVWAPAFSPDGRVVVATWFGDQSVRGFDVGTGEEVVHLEPYEESFSNAFSPDGSLLALGLRADGLVRIMDVHTGEQVRTLQLPTPWFPRDVTFSPDGHWLATTTEDGRVIVWDVATGQPRFTAAGHRGAVNSVDWSADSTRLVSAGDDGTARVWRVDDGGIRQQLVLSARESRSGLQGAAFSPDGTRVVAGNSGVTAALVWDVRPIGAAEWLAVQGVGRAVTSDGVALTPDGAEVLVPESDRKVGVWEVATGSRRLLVGGATAEGDAARVAISPGGDLVATNNDVGPVTITDLVSGAMVAEVPVEVAGGLAWSADGSVLAIADWRHDGDQIRVVDRRGRTLATRRFPAGLGPSAIATSPDGHLVAATVDAIDRQDPDSMNAELWDWRRDEVVRTIDSDTPLQGVAFDPTGRRIAFGRWLQGSAEVRDVASGELNATLSAKPSIHDMVFTPDGSLVLTANDDGQVRMWDAATGLQRGTVPTGPGAVWSLAISADGARLATVNDDGMARVLALDLDDLVAIADERLTRPLDDEECRQYLHIDACPS